MGSEQSLVGCEVLVFCGGEEWGWGIERGRMLGGDVEGVGVDLFVDCLRLVYRHLLCVVRAMAQWEW